MWSWLILKIRFSGISLRVSTYVNLQKKAKSKSWALMGLEYQLTGMSEYRDCMEVQTSFCEGGRKQSYPQMKLSVTRVSDVFHKS